MKVIKNNYVSNTEYLFSFFILCFCIKTNLKLYTAENLSTKISKIYLYFSIRDFKLLPSMNICCLKCVIFIPNL